MNFYKDLISGVSATVAGLLVNIAIANETNFDFYCLYYVSWLRLNGNPNLTLGDLQLVIFIWYITQLVFMYFTPILLKKFGSKLVMLFFGIFIPLSNFSASFLHHIYAIYLVYGAIGGLAFGGLSMISTNVAWSYLPKASGKVACTIIMGYTISPLLFSGMCLYIVNPNSLDPSIEVIGKGGQILYYYDHAVADNVPRMFHAIAAVQACLIVLAVLLIPSMKKVKHGQDEIKRLSAIISEENYGNLPPVLNQTESFRLINTEGGYSRNSTENPKLEVIGNGVGGNYIDEASQPKAETGLFDFGTPIPEEVIEQEETNLRQEIFIKGLLSRHFFPLFLISMLSYQLPIFLLDQLKNQGASLKFGDKFLTGVGDMSMLTAASGKLLLGIVFDLVDPRYPYYFVIFSSLVISATIALLEKLKVFFCLYMFIGSLCYGFNMGYFPTVSQWIFSANEGTKAYSLMCIAIAISTFMTSYGSNLLLKLGFEKVYILYFLPLSIISLAIFPFFKAKKLLT